MVASPSTHSLGNNAISVIGREALLEARVS